MTMPASVNQKEYLKKYLGGEKPKKTKKKKKSANKKMGFNIVSESNDLNDIPFGFGDDDDAPTIAEITYDDRQTNLKEQFNANSHKWKNITEPEPNDFSISIQKAQEDKVKVDTKGLPYRKRHDSDDSPVRKKERDLDTVSLGTKKTIINSSPPRRKRHGSDTSPPRRKMNDFDVSPPRRKRHDSDTSPPRRKRHDSDASPQRRKRHDSDASPPRKQRHDSDTSPSRRKRHDLNTAPLRRRRHDSDTSPPRRKIHDSDALPARRKRHDSDASPPRLPPNHADVPSTDQSTTEDVPIRPEKTMSTQEFLRARKLGRLKKDTPEDLARQKREEALQRTAGEKYTRWNRGVVQTAVAQQAAADTLHEMGKAFSRNADDADMNTHLKQAARMEDPMLEYIARKQAKEDATTGRLTRPAYKGAFPPNRLNIRPGHRWDGVDRSSGFEKEWFARQNAKRAVDEESYKWSTEDM